MKFALLAIAALSTGLAPVAHAQSFPQDSDFVSYGQWKADEEGIGASVRTDSEGGFANLYIERLSGTTMNSISFHYTFANYDGETQTLFRSLLGKDAASRVRLVVDGQAFTPVSAIIEADGEASVSVAIHFYDPADETSPDVWEKSCPVVEAISRARRISVSLPDVGFGESLEWTGKGSSAALRNIC
ncbi:hypothetical protein JIX59_16505 [Brevundimonas diminuta]|uniref:hypothetical protein n=1 Tax=Brevundimonas diminuta TaxID=293 RepID=UPI001908F07A|nr:hypothetical protein [Brevundimonas diminuta]MBK1970944.1 hypothetical protein [Brevundimonas diminuta]